MSHAEQPVDSVDSGPKGIVSSATHHAYALIISESAYRELCQGRFAQNVIEIGADRIFSAWISIA